MPTLQKISHGGEGADKNTQMTVNFMKLSLVSLISQEFLKGALSGVAQLVGCRPTKEKVTGLILVRARARVAGLVAIWATNGCLSLALMFLSLSFSLIFPLSKNK